MTMIKIGDMEHRMLRAKRVKSKTEGQVLYAKDKRKNLSIDDKTIILERAIQMAHKKYNILSLSVKDEDKLDDSCNLVVLVQKTKRENFNLICMKCLYQHNSQQS
jgi:RecA-family ATPase